MVMDYFYQGGPVMYPLLFSSLLSLTLIIERMVFWIRESGRRDRRKLDDFMDCIEKNDLYRAKKIADTTRDFVIRVMVCGVLHQEFSLRDALQMSADAEIARMKKYLSVIDTMITLSPLLGILGTVTGIIHSFHMLGTTGAENPTLVTMGISQALITTAFGLIIAIFSLIPYNYFWAKVEKATLEMEKYGTTLELLFEKKKNGYGDER